MKKGAGIIDDVQELEIVDVVNSAETREFRPLPYVIPHDLVAGLLQSVPVANKAHPLSVEYVIERLPRASFDVIDFEK